MTLLLETDPKQNFAVQFRGGDLTSETADVYQQSLQKIYTFCKLKWSRYVSHQNLNRTLAAHNSWIHFVKNPVKKKPEIDSSVQNCAQPPSKLES